MTITNDLSNFGLMANAMYNSMTANATAITSLSVGIANSANLTTTTNVATIGTAAYFVANGNVGIGTASPTARLDVSGGIRALGGATYGTGVAGYSFGTNDTDGGMFSPADGTLVFATNNAERVRIDSVGSVGIGVTSPTYKLHVAGDINAYRPGSPTTGVYYFGNGTNQYLYYDGANWTLSNSSSVLFLSGYRINLGSGYAGEKQLYIQNSARAVYFYLGSDGNNLGCWDANGGFNRFYSDVNGTFIAPAFYASSDGRLKDNQVLIDNALNKLTELNGVTYARTDLKNQDGSPVVDAGIIAQDLEKVLPEAIGSITQTPAQEPDPAIHYLTVNYNGVSALLVNAVKELNAKTDAALAAKDAEIEALKARLDALEKKLN